MDTTSSFHDFPAFFVGYPLAVLGKNPYFSRSWAHVVFLVIFEPFRTTRSTPQSTPQIQRHWWFCMILSYFVQDSGGPIPRKISPIFLDWLPLNPCISQGFPMSMIWWLSISLVSYGFWWFRKNPYKNPCSANMLHTSGWSSNLLGYQESFTN